MMKRAYMYSGLGPARVPDAVPARRLVDRRGPGRGSWVPASAVDPYRAPKWIYR